MCCTMTLQHLIHEYTELRKPIRDFELKGYASELPRYGKAVYVCGLRVRDLTIDTPRVKLSDIVNVIPELQGFTAYDVEHFLCMNHEKNNIIGKYEILLGLYNSFVVNSR